MGGIRKPVVKIEPKLTINSNEMTSIPIFATKFTKVSTVSFSNYPNCPNQGKPSFTCCLFCSFVHIAGVFAYGLRTKTIHDAGHYAETCSLDSPESFECVTVIIQVYCISISSVISFTFEAFSVSG